MSCVSCFGNQTVKTASSNCNTKTRKAGFKAVFAISCTKDFSTNENIVDYLNGEPIPTFGVVDPSTIQEDLTLGKVGYINYGLMGNWTSGGGQTQKVNDNSPAALISSVWNMQVMLNEFTDDMEECELINDWVGKYKGLHLLFVTADNRVYVLKAGEYVLTALDRNNSGGYENLENMGFTVSTTTDPIIPCTYQMDSAVYNALVNA